MRHNRAIILMLSAIFWACACRQSPEPVTVKQAREVMGTLAEITAVAPNVQTAHHAIEAAYQQLEKVNLLMSDYRQDSEVGRFNALAAGQDLVLSPETLYVLKESNTIAAMTGGAFDVTCRPLVELWKQADRLNRLPDEEAVLQTLTRIGWRKLELNPSKKTITKTVDGMQIDLGGIAKGYALDLAAAALKQAGVTNGLIDIGGDVLAIGAQADGSSWRVGVQHPFESGLICKLALANQAVATSGNQRRFHVIEGRRYSHIIDPRTGQPTEQAPSITVIAEAGLSADAWATVFSVLSIAEGKTQAEKLDGIEAMWIWGTAKQPIITKTEGFDRLVRQ